MITSFFIGAFCWIIALALALRDQRAEIRSSTRKLKDLTRIDIGLTHRLDSAALRGKQAVDEIQKSIREFKLHFNESLRDVAKRLANLEQDGDVAATERLELEEDSNEFKRPTDTNIRNLADRLHALETKSPITEITVRDFVETALTLKALNEEDAS